MGEYNPADLDKKWQEFWENNKTFRTPEAGDKKFYCLDMFPYPSGSGLHIGHPLGYTATDILCRYKRQQGYSVLHPMGYDAFGLPAEQHAVNTGEHPSIITFKSCDTFTSQMKAIGFSYDWEREVRTCTPDYYQWTQWIFLKLFNSWFDDKLQKCRPIEELPIPVEVQKEGEVAINKYQAEHRLAYEANILVNWCPGLGTVLANEEVINGRSERGDFEVIRKPMRQWMLRITKYADRLLKDLELLDWPEAIKAQQRNWIGRSEGVNIRQKIKDLNIEVEVYDSIPQTFIAQTFCVIAPEHPLVAEMIKGTEFEEPVSSFVSEIIKRKLEKRFDVENDLEGIFTGRYIENPFGKGDLPIWIASYVLVDYGTGMVNCSAHDKRDFAFAKKYGIPLRVAMLPSDAAEAEKVKNFEYSYLADDGIIQEPAECAGLNWVEARTPVIDYMESRGWATRKVNYRLRDWVFSRQRYWGEPIPVIHWEDGRSTSLTEDQLPLVLPEVKDFKPSESGESPLAKSGEWLEVIDPKTGIKGRRETNTMPQWAGSCWYYLRFIDPKNSAAAWSPDLEKKWMSVDLYVGGAEHAVLHLLYSRFWHKVLFDLGYVSTVEPFQKLFNQGMIQSYAFKDSRGALIPTDLVIDKEGIFTHKISGEKLERIVAKMSKSLKNVVNPVDVLRDYGADTLRMFLMFLGPLEASKPWNPLAISGVHRFLKRVWTFALANKDQGIRDLVNESEEHRDVIKERHKLVARVTRDLDQMQFNTAIAGMMEFLNAVGDKPVSKATLESLTIVLSPFAPHLCEEIWQRLGHQGSLAYCPWPGFDPAQLKEDSVTVVVQVNGKKRATLEVDIAISDDDLKSKVMASLEGTAYEVPTSAQFITVRNPQNKAPKLVSIVLK